MRLSLSFPKTFRFLLEKRKLGKENQYGPDFNYFENTTCALRGFSLITALMTT